MKPSLYPRNRIFHSTLNHRLPPLTFRPVNPNQTLHLIPINHTMSTTTSAACRDNVLVIMGATGAGKSRLSIDMATRFPPAEIINSDKIQVYKGLDITTNKITSSEQAGVPHHLLGTFDSSIVGDLSPVQFRDHATEIITQISARNSLPILVGGSNSFVHALLTDEFDPTHDPFSETDDIGSCSLRYRCCFLWVDVSLPVLYKYLEKRVDEMIESGMIDELAKYYKSGEYDVSPPRTGLNKAIGVPEFETYFRSFSSNGDSNSYYDYKYGSEWDDDDEVRKRVFDAAVSQIKENTCRLAKRQLEKIQRLRKLGWDVKRVDATEAFKKGLDAAAGGDDWRSVWEKKVVQPSTEIVERFLQKQKEEEEE